MTIRIHLYFIGMLYNEDEYTVEENCFNGCLYSLGIELKI